MFIKLRDIALRWRFNSLCDILGIANGVMYYLSAPPFAPLYARQIHRITLHPLVDIHTITQHHSIHTPKLLNI